MRILLILLNFSLINGLDRQNIDSLPYGPFYCQARCLASCVETNLANSLEQCTKFCPPFDRAMPCPPNNADCWKTCGIPAMPDDKPPPPAVNFVMAQQVTNVDQSVQDPFTIELTWDPVPTASLYIVELYPLNRQPRPGENNFFRAVTSFPTYMVRKEDECITYDIRVMPVNAFGIGAPQYTRIEAPRPTMTGSDNFYVRNIRRDSNNPEFVAVVIDYRPPSAWPLEDIEFLGVRVKGVECRGNNFSSLDDPTSTSWYPFYDILIGKSPVPTIQLAFLNDVVKSDCLFQMRVSALNTRCNTTTYFDSNGGANLDSTVGIDFRINCLTAQGFTCDNEQVQPWLPPFDEISMPVPPPMPSIINNSTDPITIIQPPPPSMANAPPLVNVGQLDLNAHPFLIDYLAINSQIPMPPLCDMETIDVQPSPSILGFSLIDLSISWIERNPISSHAPTYFVIRYGPIVRNLVEDRRQPHRIMNGHEMIVRTSVTPIGPQFMQTPPERQIKVIGLPQNGLLSFQICAIYDALTEQSIVWEMVQSQQVDLLALQGPPDMKLAAFPNNVITSLAPLATDESPLAARPADNGPISIDQSDQSIPIMVQIGLIDGHPSITQFWLMLIGGLSLAIFMAIMIFIFILRLRSKDKKKLEITTYPKPVPIAMITKAQIQPMSEKEKEAMGEKDVEKIALP